VCVSEGIWSESTAIYTSDNIYIYRTVNFTLPIEFEAWKRVEPEVASKSNLMQLLSNFVRLVTTTLPWKPQTKGKTALFFSLEK
jgi:hypothetical protein